MLATVFQNLLDHEIETERSHFDLVRDDWADDEAHLAEQQSEFI